EPAVTPVTRPLPLTVATLVLLLPHVTVRPVRVPPFASLGVAVSCVVPPSATLADAGATVTVATGTCTTVVTAVPPLPPPVPAALPVTSPAALTVATLVLLLAHVTARPTSGLPFASFGVAVSGTVFPSSTVAVAGVTSTVATGTVVPTVIAPVSLSPSLLAVILAAPLVPPVTAPRAPTATAHSAARSAAGLSPDGCSAIIVKPVPGVIASPLLVTPNTPYATLSAPANGASATLSPFTASPAFDPVCPIAPAPFAPLASTPLHCDTIHWQLDTA